MAKLPTTPLNIEHLPARLSAITRPLPVCKRSLRKVHGLSGHEMQHLDTVATGVDVRIGGLESLVDDDGPFGRNHQTRFDRQFGIGSYPNGRDDEIGIEGPFGRSSL